MSYVSVCLTCINFCMDSSFFFFGLLFFFFFFFFFFLTTLHTHTHTERVTHQVKYLGLLENVKVKRAGFSFRQTYSEFVRRYKMLGGTTTWPKSERNDDKSDTTTILQTAGVMVDEFQYGRSKIFLRQPMTLFLLEEQRDRKLHDIANLIHSCYRSWKARKYFLKLKELSMSLFGGQKRRRGSIHLYFVGDYVQATNNVPVQKVLHQFHEKKILFADYVEKIDTKFRHSQRLLVCTEHALYNFDCTSTGMFSKTKTYKLQRRMPLESIQSISLSTFADHYFVVCLEYPGDGRGDYLMQSSRKAEIVTCLKNALDVKKKTLQLTFNNELEWKRKKNKMGKAVFQEDTNIPETECMENGNRKTSTLTIQVGAGMCSRAPIQLDTSYRASSSKSNTTTSRSTLNNSSSRATTSTKSSTKSSFSRGGESKRQNSGKKAVPSTKTPPSVPSRSKKAAPPPVPSRKEMVKALFDYEGVDSDELSMTTGMRLTVISRKEPDAPEGWVKCSYGGKEGLVPANYVGKS